MLPPSIFQVALFHLSLCLYIFTSISLSDSFLPLSHLHISVYHILYRISSINISFSSMHVFIFLICTYVLYMYEHLYSTVVYVRAYISLPTSDVLLRSLCLSNYKLKRKFYKTPYEVLKQLTCLFFAPPNKMNKIK